MKIRAAALVALLIAIRLGAQPPDHALTKLRGLHLPEVPGRMPLIYSPAAERQALRLQKALQAAHGWYQKRLHLRLPLTLAVLDRETFAKVTSIPMPFSYANPGLVVLPSSLEDMTSLRPPGVDFALTSEAVAFHEAWSHLRK